METGRISSKTALIFAATFVGATALVAGATVGVAAGPRLAVSVVYDKRECAGAKAKVTPVTAGIVELDRPGPADPVRVTLEEDGADPERIAVPEREQSPQHWFSRLRG